MGLPPRPGNRIGRKDKSRLLSVYFAKHRVAVDLFNPSADVGIIIPILEMRK